MSSVTKNPMIMQSALNVYNWFLSLSEKEKKFLENAMYLNSIKSDEIILHNLKKELIEENNILNYEQRINELEKKIIGDISDKQYKK